jgi:hypothetical protein
MNEPAASRQTRTDDNVEGEPQSDLDNGQIMSRAPTSGAKGFAVILGTMLGIIGLLWLIATLVAPH